MTSQAKVLVVAPYFLPATRAGGPVRTLAALVPTAPAHLTVDLVTRHADHGAPLPADTPEGSWVDFDGYRVFYANPRKPWQLVREVASGADVVYLNSFFDAAYSILPQVVLCLLARSSMVLIAPRGELTPGALSIKSPRKTLFLAIYRILRLHRRVWWHASAQREADEIRQVMGPEARVIVRSNETSLPADPIPPTEPRVGPLRAVYLSRLVTKKGLHVLLEALSYVSGPVELDIYGVEEDAAYVRLCRSLAERMGGTIRFHGAVDPAESCRVLAAHDVMFFPTESENFGHVIVEALSASCPVVLPDTTPWTDLIRRHGGAVVEDLQPASWARVIQEWTELLPADRWTRRQEAGRAFEEWRRTPPESHVFELALKARSKRREGSA